ncbi:MAG: ferredoxin [Candidatus Aenigmatarchaeota archaeon]
MKPEVDKEKCIGCGACAAICPEVFEIKNGKSHVKNPDACDSCDCKEAADSCPVNAISLK